MLTLHSRAAYKYVLTENKLPQFERVEAASRKTVVELLEKTIE